MSRLRKGKKYKGAGFADHFKSACAMKSPLYKVTVAGESPEIEEQPSTPAVEEKTTDLEQSGASQATIESTTDKDIIPKKVGSTNRMSAREDWMKRTEDKKKKAADAVAAEEKAVADELAERTYETESGETGFVDDYEEGSSRKDRKGEHKSNKQEIKELRKTGEISRKEAKDLKKTSKKLKKSNRKATKAARKADRRARKGK